MARMIVPIANGDYNTDDGSMSVVGEILDSTAKQISFSYSGATPSAGNMVVYARASDGAPWEPLPEGTVDLTNPLSILFTFSCEAYRFVLTGVSGHGFIGISEYEL